MFLYQHQKIFVDVREYSILCIFHDHIQIYHISLKDDLHISSDINEYNNIPHIMELTRCSRALSSTTAPGRSGGVFVKGAGQSLWEPRTWKREGSPSPSFSSGRGWGMQMWRTLVVPPLRLTCGECCVWGLRTS